MKEAQTPPPKETKKRKALVLSLAVAPVLLGLIFAGILISRATYKPVIGFLDVPDTVRQAIEETAQSWSTTGKTPFRYITLHETHPEELKKTYSKLDMLIASSGKNAEALSSLSQKPSPAILSLMPSAMRKAGMSGEKQYAFPILLDHFELAWNIKLLSRNGLSKPTSIQDMRTYGSKIKSKTVWPMIVAGADDRILLGFIGSITEALYGEETWKKIQSTAFESTPEELLQTPELSAVLDTLSKWRLDQFLHPEWFRMTQDDVIQFMENDYALFVCMFLSDHRKIPQKTIEQYDSTFMPSVSAQGLRSFTIPAMLVLQPRKDKTNRTISAFGTYIIQNETQKNLSGRTGLAPSNAQCESPDKQASEVRLWAAASANLLPPFSSALYYDPLDTKKIARLIREYLESR